MRTGISRSLLSQHSLATLTAIRLKQQLIHMPRYIDRREFVGATQLNYSFVVCLSFALKYSACRRVKHQLRC